MPDPSLIPKLIGMLVGYPASSTVANPYASSQLARNAAEYFHALLSHPYSGDLLVGEAPGHAGCALTGIPLTSEHIIAHNTHPFIVSLRPRLYCSGAQTESTATMVWNCISRGSRLPAFWNTFPLHPHPHSGMGRNRRPTPAEANFGVTALDLVIRILTPQRVFALGRVAEGILAVRFSHLATQYIRHPSNGGRSDFTIGMITHKVI